MRERSHYGISKAFLKSLLFTIRVCHVHSVADKNKSNTSKERIAGYGASAAHKEVMPEIRRERLPLGTPALTSTSAKRKSRQ